MENRKNSKKIPIIIVVILIILALLIGGFFLWQNYITQKDYEKIAESVTKSTVETTLPANIKNTESTDSSDKKVDNPINFKELLKINSEVIGWINVPDTNIDYPILQSLKSDDFYLHKDIYGKYKYAGSIFVEYCNNKDFKDRVTLMYGHNMLNGSMFANLHKFSDTDFFNKHPYFYVYTKDRKLTYQVVSSYIYDDRHIMNSFNFAEDDVFEEYLSYIQNPRSVTKNVRTELEHKLTVDDKILTLSTCLNGGGNGRYLLQGVLIKDEYTG